MAEIGIQKKRPIWPWIILVLIILAILYFLLYADDDTTDDADDNETEQIEDTVVFDSEFSDTTSWDREISDTLSDPLMGFAGYQAYIQDTTQMGVNEEYTNNAIIQLTNALEIKSKELDMDLSVDLQGIREETNKIIQDPQGPNHAGTIKNAGTKISQVLQKMQRQKYPNLSQDVQEVTSAVGEIEPSAPTLQQKEKIQAFFREAAEVLEKME